MSHDMDFGFYSEYNRKSLEHFVEGNDVAWLIY